MIGQLFQRTTKNCGCWKIFVLIISLFCCQSDAKAETKSGDKKPILQNRQSDLVHTFKTKGRVTSVAFSPNGRYLAAVTMYSYISTAPESTPWEKMGFLYLWEVSTKKQLYSIPIRGFQNAVTFSPDGTKIYTAGGLYETFGEILIWDARAGRLLAKHEEPEHMLCLAVSPDGKTVVGGTFDYAVVVDGSNAKLIRRLMGRGGEAIISVAYAPRGRLIVAGGDRNSLRVWNTDDGTLVQPELDGFISSVVFAPDKRSFLTVGGEGAKIWNFHPFQEIRRFGKPDVEMGVIAISSDSTLIAISSGSISNEKKKVPILIWNWKQGRYVRPLQGHDAAVECLAFGGKRVLASGGADKCVRLWNISD